MDERLLQFIWQFQYYNRNQLLTTDGEPLVIVQPGKWNLHQGPDFLNAKIIVANTTLAGNIELHLNATDWLLHKHNLDSNYDNIILHVVWQNNGPVYSNKGLLLPTLELQPLVPKLLLDRFRELMLKKSFVACDDYLPAINELKWTLWKERLAVERLQRKSGEVLELLKQANNNWEEVFWWMIARNFGVKINTHCFEAVARSIPVRLLAKHKNQIHQIEALLLGQAGLLNGTFSEAYPQMLQKEYHFYAAKYQLVQTTLPPHFLRMRPANFPTIRLAQLAMLITQSLHLFSKVVEAESVTDLYQLLSVTANDYWHYHYQFDEPGSYKPKSLGRQMIENLVINTIVPVVFAYGNYTGSNRLTEKAIRWLEELTAEKNNITLKWQEAGVTNLNALESQALIELKNNYCDERRCLQCTVGNALLSGKPIT